MLSLLEEINMEHEQTVERSLAHCVEEFLAIQPTERLSKIQQMAEAVRSNNLATHIKEVKQKYADRVGYQNDTHPSVSGLKNLEQWSQHVQDIDPRNKVLSEIWQGIMVDIMAGVEVLPEVVDALKSLNTEEAKRLLIFQRKRQIRANHIDPYFAQSLIAKGLLVKKINFAIIGAGAIYLFSIVSCLILLAVPPKSPAMGKSILMDDPSLIVALGVFSFVMTSTLIIWKLGLHQLTTTWLGKAVLRHAPGSEFSLY